MKILKEILQELVQIKKELQAIRSSKEFKFDGCLTAKNGTITSQNSTIHGKAGEAR